MMEDTVRNITKPSASTTSFRTHDFDDRYLLDFYLYCTDDSILSSVAILGFWRCT